MQSRNLQATPALFLGIEAGGTKSVAIFADQTGNCKQRIETREPANLRLLDDGQLVALFGKIAHGMPCPASIGIGMAGALDHADRMRIRSAAASVWRGTPCWAGHDLETALAAADDPFKVTKAARVIVISGTGASCFGRTRQGEEILTVGWGHLLGDSGSGYDIVVRSLQNIFRVFDKTGGWPPLGRRLCEKLGLASHTDLIAWAASAGKRTIASLAEEIFAAAAARDVIASEVLEATTSIIAENASACARRVAGSSSALEFVLTGSVLLRQPGFASSVGKKLLALRRNSTVRLLEREGAWGGVYLGRLEGDKLAAHPEAETVVMQSDQPRHIIPQSTGLPPTELRNPLSSKLDTISVSAAIRLMLEQDETLPAALLREEKKIAQAIKLIVQAFRSGGRLIYVGAGTSGRLGALDAYECPPTFSVSPEMVQSIVAGGSQALTSAKEDAEDDLPAGAAALRERNVSPKDVVIGIAASGRTPFVWGAMDAAMELGATTIFICFNPNLSFKKSCKPTLVITPETGPELLTGSTRLKAGTATKLLLNILTTVSMVQIGKVKSNLMVDVQPTNAKLRQRAVRIITELTGAPAETITSTLERNQWLVKAALEEIQRGNKKYPSDGS